MPNPRGKKRVRWAADCDVVKGEGQHLTSGSNLTEARRRAETMQTVFGSSSDDTDELQYLTYDQSDNESEGGTMNRLGTLVRGKDHPDSDNVQARERKPIERTSNDCNEVGKYEIDVGCAYLMEWMEQEMHEEDKTRAECVLATARPTEPGKRKPSDQTKIKQTQDGPQRDECAAGEGEELQGVVGTKGGTAHTGASEARTSGVEVDVGDTLTSDVERQCGSVRVLRKAMARARRRHRQQRAARAFARRAKEKGGGTVERPIPKRDQATAICAARAVMEKRRRFDKVVDYKSPAPAEVRLVQRWDRGHEGEMAPVRHIGVEDGLPTAMMWFHGEQRPVKLDTGAQFTVAGTEWMQFGKKQRGRPPVEEVEGLGGFKLDVLGVWQFDAVNVYGQRVLLNACVVDGIESEFLVGTDFLEKHEASIDYNSHEVRYGNGRSKVVIPFKTFNHESEVGAAVARVVRRTKVDTQQARSMEVAVPAEDGEIGLFIPTAVNHGNVMVAATLTAAKDGKVSIPVLNVDGKRIKLPGREELGTWIPVDQDMELLEASGAMTRQKVEEWLKNMPGDEKPLRNEAEINISTTDDEERALLLKLLRIYRTTLESEGDCPPSTATGVKHHIDTGTHAPIMEKRRRHAQSENEIIDDNVRKMLASGVIEEANGAWGFPVVLVKKKDGEVRFCIDYRSLNKITKRDVYPLPRIDETLEALHGARRFSTLDLKAGYWQIEMAEEDKDKTAFTTRQGLYRFVRMPFGLMNAPSTFQRMMNCVLRGLTWLTCLVYLDDIIIYTRGSIERHVVELAVVLERLRIAGLSLKPKKCSFATNTIEYLGHQLAPEGIKPLDRLVDAVRQFPAPKDEKEVKRFVHLAGYYRRFVAGFGSMMAPLTKLLRKGSEWEWGGPQQRAFDQIKAVLTAKPLLIYPDFTKPFVIVTDASVVGLGACLMQDHGQGLQPVAYASKVNNPVVAKYPIHELECLAVIWAVKLFRPFIYGRRFTVNTDHRALSWLMKSPHLVPRLHRWALTLQEYDFSLKYRAGRTNVVADGLSRAPVPDEGSSDVSIMEVGTTNDGKPAAGSESDGLCGQKSEKDSALVRLIELGEDPAVSDVEINSESSVTNVKSSGSNLTRGTPKARATKTVRWSDGKRRRTVAYAVTRSQTRPSALSQATDSDDEATLRSGEDQLVADECQIMSTSEPDPRSAHSGQERTGCIATTPNSGDQAKGLHDSIGAGMAEPGELELPPLHPSRFTPRESEGTRDQQGVQSQRRWLSCVDISEGGTKRTERAGSDEPTLQLTDEMIKNEQKRSKLVARLLESGVYRDMKVQSEHGLVVIMTAAGSRIILPPALWAVVFKEHHDSIWAGHFRGPQSYARIAQVYWWPNMHREVNKWVAGCQECGSRKARPREVIPPLRPIKGGEVGDRWALDVAGPFPLSTGGVRFVIAAVEYVTRYAVARTVREHKAECVAQFIMEEIVLRFGAFRELLTDNAPEMVGNVLNQLMDMLQATQTNPVPYRPQMIGLVERFHRTWKDCVSLYMEDEGQKDWDVWVRCAVYAYNSAKHTTVGLSPNELMMGRRLRAPNELLRASRVTEAGKMTEYHRRLVEHLKQCHEHAATAMTREQLRQARYYDRHVRSGRTFAPGDRVWMYHPPRDKKLTKFVHQWLGPVVVVQPAGYDNYLVRREDKDGDREEHIVHCSFLVSYHFPKSLLVQEAEDIRHQLEDEELYRLGGHTARATTIESTAVGAVCAATARGSASERATRTRDPAAILDEWGGALVEVRRRRRRNAAGRYVLEYEVEPVVALDSGATATTQRDGTKRRWVTARQYDELWRADRVVADPGAEEGV